MISEKNPIKMKNINDKKRQEFLKKVKSLLTQETLNVAWVLQRGKGYYRKFELRLNKCTQFPSGFYELVSIDNAREAKIMLYTKLIEKLEEK